MTIREHLNQPSQTTESEGRTHKGQTAPMDVAFGTLMHDVYNEFLCGSPTFGFVKSTTHRNRLEVDFL